MDRLAAGVEWLHGYGLVAPVVQLLLATVFGFFFVERWQRWRQRRDFQYRTLVKFSDLSFDMIDRLMDLHLGRDLIDPAVLAERRREMVRRGFAFFSMRSEVVVCYSPNLYEDYRGLLNALTTLLTYARVEPVPDARFEREQATYLARRDVVIADMMREMRLVSRQQHRAEMRSARETLQQANAAASGSTAGRGQTLIA